MGNMAHPPEMWILLSHMEKEKNYVVTAKDAV